MATPAIKPTQIERVLGEEDIIVSKTDLTGRITYVNRVFVDISLYTEQELLDQPHSMIRHPDMPRCIFKLMWDTIGAGHEIFAYAKNMCKNGDYYWVFAHVTPNFGANGEVTGYHSNRRRPEQGSLATIKGIYSALLDKEMSIPDRKASLAGSWEMLLGVLKDKGVEYDEFIFSV